ncbi:MULTISPECIES: TIGR02234 family membrane protein [Streptomycetaceae]|uniref:TIGR02234 family membrane protein n=1 Tax=Streptantibioticus cattleyicolor (strain ATCC 35852 / DSM 46488 / JCM 4925 / NBRC 14057 / NRRL 8057) TaxID=1003195 RepID=F8JZU8_STREN|nr:TIGR02234 family membrane protein [Streptantibioticus cattleyicolor]AEW93532.1 hypothetical protein SCATT_11610 [Streptantibioticus cattleyicolor NRRL 8057 = DSM 46488]MYS58240.1 TIGR02234 family membrane protein [Streptomyces sp. SID5468]CCB73882.1 putative membrane protein [Streptantibioticus cattleyicolor NRRL 8057 = DSM 46488]
MAAPPDRPDHPAPPKRPARASLAAALLLGAAGAAVVLLAVGKTWATGLAPAVGGTVPVHAGGKAVTGLPGALALVGLAALVAVFAVRRVGRLIVSVLLALCGAGVIAAAVAGAADTSAVNDAAARASGLTSTTAQHIAHTGWPWITALGGALLLLAGLLAVARGARWPGMSARYERAGARPAPRPRRAPVDPDHPGELWKALDRGEDPTQR